MWSRKTTWSKGHVTLRAGTHQGKLPSSKFGGYRHSVSGDVFSLSHDLGVMTSPAPAWLVSIVSTSICTCLPNLVVISLMEMEISIFISNLTWMPRKKRSSLHRSAENRQLISVEALEIIITEQKKISLKLVSSIFYQIFIFSPIDSPSKTIKNVFSLIEKVLFVLEIFKSL